MEAGMRKTHVIIVTLIALCGAAKADFIMGPSLAPSAPTQSSTASTATVAPQAAAPKPDSSAEQRPSKKTPRAARAGGHARANARGFGCQVPLDFAARQI